MQIGTRLVVCCLKLAAIMLSSQLAALRVVDSHVYSLYRFVCGRMLFGWGSGPRFGHRLLLGMAAAPVRSAEIVNRACTRRTLPEELQNTAEAECNAHGTTATPKQCHSGKPCLKKPVSLHSCIAAPYSL